MLLGAAQMAPKTPAEILQMVNLHGRWLAKKTGGLRADLTLQDLSARELMGINLSAAKLVGCNFSLSNLAGSNFDQADLYSADMSNADLTEASFIGANMRGVCLRDARIIRANLADAD